MHCISKFDMGDAIALPSRSSTPYRSDRWKEMSLKRLHKHENLLRNHSEILESVCFKVFSTYYASLYTDYCSFWKNKYTYIIINIKLYQTMIVWGCKFHFKMSTQKTDVMRYGWASGWHERKCCQNKTGEGYGSFQMPKNQTLRELTFE